MNSCYKIYIRIGFIFIISYVLLKSPKKESPVKQQKFSPAKPEKISPKKPSPSASEKASTPKPDKAAHPKVSPRKTTVSRLKIYVMKSFRKEMTVTPAIPDCV